MGFLIPWHATQCNQAGCGSKQNACDAAFVPEGFLDFTCHAHSLSGFQGSKLPLINDKFNTFGT
jgi:hypothetical protein